mmetsp:Transcript_13105/g.43633  ORF Transcript_13105/g.43633 Transcript_13105/m.43633 type:complete len:302 (+) Transcript_13105:538-1443(+)
MLSYTPFFSRYSASISPCCARSVRNDLICGARRVLLSLICLLISSTTCEISSSVLPLALSTSALSCSACRSCSSVCAKPATPRLASTADSCEVTELSCPASKLTVRDSVPHSARSPPSSAFIRLYCAVLPRSSAAYLRNSSPRSTGWSGSCDTSAALLASSASTFALSRRTASSRCRTCSRFLATRDACCRNIASRSSGSEAVARFRSSSSRMARCSPCRCCSISRVSDSLPAGSESTCCSSSCRCCLCTIARGSSSCARRLIAATSASSFCSRRPKSLTPASAFLPASARESCSSRCSAW